MKNLKVSVVVLIILCCQCLLTYGSKAVNAQSDPWANLPPPNVFPQAGSIVSYQTGEFSLATLWLSKKRVEKQLPALAKQHGKNQKWFEVANPPTGGYYIHVFTVNDQGAEQRFVFGPYNKRFGNLKIVKHRTKKISLLASFDPKAPNISQTLEPIN